MFFEVLHDDGAVSRLPFKKHADADADDDRYLAEAYALFDTLDTAVQRILAEPVEKSEPLKAPQMTSATPKCWRTRDRLSRTFSRSLRPRETPCSSGLRTATT